MKNLLLLLVSLAILSCGSDNLSNSKAEDIIEDCLEKTPEKRTVMLNIDQIVFGTDEERLKKYQKLEEDGFIEMKLIDTKAEIKKPNAKNDPLAQWRYEAEMRRAERNKNTYNVKITNKSKKYIDDAPEGRNWITMKTFIYEVDKVLEVQEIPAMNAAKVKVQFKAEDITPFAILSAKDPTEFWVKDVNMTKTSNGWKYCDNF